MKQFKQAQKMMKKSQKRRYAEDDVGLAACSHLRFKKVKVLKFVRRVLDHVRHLHQRIISIEYRIPIEV